MANSTPLGLTIPIRRGNLGYFNQAFDIRTQAKSNLINLILTKKGERLMQPDFGCDIYQYLFQPIDDNNQSEIRASIEQCTSIWLPYITIDDVQVSREEVVNKIKVVISFSVKSNIQITDVITLLL